MTDFAWVEDRQASASTELQISEVSFSDGYVHRAQKSLNPEQTTYTLSFINRYVEEINAIVSFLKGKGGYIAFSWHPHTCPETQPDISVVCKSWTRTIPINGIESLNTTFKVVTYGIEACP